MAKHNEEVKQINPVACIRCQQLPAHARCFLWPNNWFMMMMMMMIKIKCAAGCGH